MLDYQSGNNRADYLFFWNDMKLKVVGLLITLVYSYAIVIWLTKFNTYKYQCNT